MSHLVQLYLWQPGWRAVRQSIKKRAAGCTASAAWQCCKKSRLDFCVGTPREAICYVLFPDLQEMIDALEQKNRDEMGKKAILHSLHVAIALMGPHSKAEHVEVSSHQLHIN